MIHTMGDSHCWLTFSGIPEVSTNHIGPRTMKRVGYEADILMGVALNGMRLAPNDVLIVCFGEIDIRCFVKPNLDRKRNITSWVLLKDWADRYLDQVARLRVPAGVRIFVMSVVPPAPFGRADTKAFPVAGTDAERAQYTEEMNNILCEGCKTRNLGFFNIYSKYKDSAGMMRDGYGDSSVHIADTRYVRELLVEMGLL